MKEKRVIDIDILRALIIVSAFLLHFNSNFHIGFLATPSYVVQKSIFTVGGFFFFIAGYMARKVYLDRYLDNPSLHTKIIFIKGLKILSIYVLYVFFMRIFTNTDIPINVISFLFHHRFFTKVLFTFGLLYMLTPLFLFFVVNYKKLLIVTIFFLTLLVIAYDSHWSIPYSLKILMIDRQLFLYPLFSSIVVYAIGFTISNFENNYNKEICSFKIVSFAVVVICVHLFLIKNINPYRTIVFNKQYFTLIESITPYIAIITIRYLTNINSIYKYLSTSYILCVGILSLHFYVISNILIGLLSLSKESAFGIRFLGLLGVCFLSYMFTIWRFGSVYGKISLTKFSA